MGRARMPFLALGLLGLMAVASPAQADPVVVSFMGEVTSLENNGYAPPAGVLVGDPVTGSMAYDPGSAPPDTFPTEPTVGLYEYTTADAQISFSIGTLVWSTHGMLTPLDVIVYDERSDGTNSVDRFSGDAIGGSGFTSFPSLIDEGRLRFVLQDISPPLQLVSNDLLPDRPSDLQLANVSPGQAVGSIASTDLAIGSNGWRILFEIDVQTFAFEVPEPSSLLLLGVGLVAAGIAGRRERRTR